MTAYTCARCDAEAMGGRLGVLPDGWSLVTGKSGQFVCCAKCAAPDVAKGENRALCQAMASGDAPSFASDDVITAAAQTRLRTIVERLERINEDRLVCVNDFKEVLAEAKGEGFDTVILRKVLALRAMDKVKREEMEAMLDLYMSAIGM